MNFTWREGSRTPKGISADAFMDRLGDLEEPSPEASFEASKKKRDLLHEATWGEGDQVWANQARLDFHRRLIGSAVSTVVVGGKNIEIRAVEFVRKDGKGHWMNIEDICHDEDLRDAYMNEIIRLQEQSAAKMEKFRLLMKSEV